jgi:acyl carrier protein
MLVETTRLARSHHVYAGLTKTEHELQGIWLDLLGLPSYTLRREDDFFGLGGTSLQAAGLFSKIRSTLGVKLTMTSLFDHPKLQQMATLIDGQQNGVTYKNNEREILLQDVQIGNDIKPIPGTAPDWTSETEGNVILTGATGFLGIFLLAELVACSYVRGVVCLVRASNEAKALSRVIRSFQNYDIHLETQQRNKIIAVPADFAAPDLGLDSAKYDQLAVWGSVIFHLGAHVHYVQPYQLHRASNVLGTLNILHFANTGRLKAVHYTSSISAYGPTGLVIGRDFVPENDQPKAHIEAVLLDTGYAQSKLVAESILWNAIDNGFPICIYRPAFVLGHSKKGTTNPDDFLGHVV